MYWQLLVKQVNGYLKKNFSIKKKNLAFRIDKKPLNPNKKLQSKIEKCAQFSNIEEYVKKKLRDPCIGKKSLNPIRY